MRFYLLAACALFALSGVSLQAQPTMASPADTALDDVKALVARLDLERYRATIKGLTQFGDRRQGTARNRAAVDWIEAQLRSFGCTPTERIKYEYQPRVGRRAGTRHARAHRREHRFAAAARPPGPHVERGAHDPRAARGSVLDSMPRRRR